MSRNTEPAGPAGDGFQTYDDAEAATRLGVTKRWLADRARAGRVPHIKFGRERRFTDEHLERIAAMHTVDPAERMRRRRPA